MKVLSVCWRLIRIVTQKLKDMIVIGCISLYVETNSDRHQYISWTENEGASTSCPPLPDDVLEMILLRLPLSSLMVARCVCRTWRYMTTTPSFIQMWHQVSCHSPWLFLFAISRGSCEAGEIQALDVSRNQWHRISHDLLKMRDRFSVLRVVSELYIIGGCTLPDDPRQPRLSSYIKTLNGVSVFNPLTGSWREAAPMKSPRLTPALGVFDYSFRCALNFDADENVQKRDSHVDFIIIVVGGLGPQNQSLDTGEIYDPMSNRWVDIARLPVEFGAVASGAVCGEEFYVYSASHKLASYNLVRGHWVTIQISQPATNGFNQNLFCCSGRLFLLCVFSISYLEGRERYIEKLWELVLPSSTRKVVTMLLKSSSDVVETSISYTSDWDRIYSFQMSHKFGKVLQSFNCLDDKLTWKFNLEKYHAHEQNASLSSTKSISVLHL